MHRQWFRAVCDGGKFCHTIFEIALDVTVHWRRSDQLNQRLDEAKTAEGHVKPAVALQALFVHQFDSVFRWPVEEHFAALTEHCLRQIQVCMGWCAAVDLYYETRYTFPPSFA